MAEIEKLQAEMTDNAGHTGCFVGWDLFQRMDLLIRTSSQKDIFSRLE